MSDEYTLYTIDIQTAVSPSELHAFTDSVETLGYTVVTDLEHGTIEVRGKAEGYDG